MSARTITFRVEENQAKNRFWYTLVAGNGDTVMTSKSDYSEKAGARRAARRMIKALRSTDLVLEYTDRTGRLVRETEDVAASEAMTPEQGRANPAASPYAG